jgi:glycerol-3-phosphate acyltransferase PlsY
MTAPEWAVLLGAYLLGSIPSAYIVGRIFARVDIRRIGDGNMGARNAYRTIGRLPGLIVVLADVGKGGLAVIMARDLGQTETAVLLAGLCVVLGHDLPIFLGFRGGQGMATILGVVGVLFPVLSGIALILILVTLLLTRNWDLSCAVGCVAMLVVLWLSGESPLHLAFVLVLEATIGLSKLLQVQQGRGVTA